MIPNDRRPNVIVLILDAVRARNISAYGGPPGATPHLDAFAAENVLFKRAFSPGTWTIPTHASLLTGLYLSQHRIESTKADRCFNDAIVALPSALHSHGYRTVAFSQNFLFSPKYQFGEFDEFHDMDEVMKSHPLLGGVRWTSNESGGLQNSAVIRYIRKLTGLRRFLDAMYDWIEAQREGTPFFLMANVANAHYPWAPPPELFWRAIGFKLGLLRNRELFAPNPFQFNSGKRQVTKTHRHVWLALYNAAVSHIDREVGRFLRRLRRWRGWENTIIVVTADHGEMLGDYQGMFGHMLSLNDNLLHVPLIIRHPACPGPIIVERVVQNLDLYTSILEWTGCPTATIPAAQLQRPGLSVAMQAPHDLDGVAFAEEDYSDSYNPVPGLRRVNPRMDPKKYPERQISVRTATHKYIWASDQPGKFYNLTSDPEENRNLMDGDTIAEQTTLSELHQALETWRAGLEYFPPKPVNDVSNVDPVTLERLRDLGYVE
jgi:arylsulfatase A-like enzyme